LEESQDFDISCGPEEVKKRNIHVPMRRIARVKIMIFFIII
jgi:hypothetical protein